MNDSTTLQKALFSIKKLKQLLQEQKNKFAEPIAIVGLSCRFPHANNKDEYWNVLSQGKNTVTQLPEARWQLLRDTNELKQRDRAHPYYGSYLDNISDFDAYFFGISPREALRMDPQQRLLLEVAHEAILDANLTTKSLAGTHTGIFVSLYASQYAHLQKLENEMDALFLPTGNATSIAANRLSYFYDLRGPSLMLDTACSSSLVALHLACLNLQTQSCEMALVGAVNINLLPSINLILAKAKMLSPTGQCKTFDAAADGYVPGEGAGMLVLKPLSKALRNRDQVYAVIAGSAVNQDGKTNGLTAPNGLQQEKLLQAAYQAAHIQPQDISYIECHGTGTFLGDPIEMQALGAVVGKNRSAEQPCWIGSVKTNIGHLEPAAGIAGVIKVALALQHAKIPQHLNFATPNPHIAFDKYHLAVPQHMIDWPQYGAYRAAGVSSFGFGGANAHIVMRELTDEEKLLAAPVTTKPAHAWQRKKYWSAENFINENHSAYPLRGKYFDSPLATKQIQFLFDAKVLPEVADTFHVLHAGYYLEMLAFAAQELFQTAQFTLENVQFMSPLLVPNGTLVDVQLILSRQDDVEDGSYLFNFYSKPKNQTKWVEHTKGQLILGAAVELEKMTHKLMHEKNADRLPAETFYQRIDNMGMPTGDTIRWTLQSWRHNDKILCEFREPKPAENSENFALKLHPGIIDACVQPIFLLLNDDIKKPYVAMSMQKIKYFGRKNSHMHALTTLKTIHNNGEKVFADWCLFDEHNQMIASCENICMAQLNNTMNIKDITQLTSSCDYQQYLQPEEQKKAIIEYLIEQFSHIFSMPKQDIGIHDSLQQLGMDSLLALAVMRVIETGLSFSLSMQEIMQDISIEKIATTLLSAQDQQPSVQKSLDHSIWIAYRQKQLQPKLRLFCFPYGGAGASIYRDWQKSLPDHIEVCPIQLPGRENRLDEKPSHDLNELIESLITALQPELDLPFAFFGHSFGSLIAFELARRLRERNLPQPIHLFASAFPDPKLPSKSLDNLLRQLKTIDIELHHLSRVDLVENLQEEKLQAISHIFNENGVVEYRENMMSKDIMKILLPIFVGDMSIVKSYHYSSELPLDLPITVFLGKHDTWVLEQDHYGWAEHTQRDCQICAFDSGHLFIKERDISQEITKKIADMLLS